MFTEERYWVGNIGVECNKREKDFTVLPEKKTLRRISLARIKTQRNSSLTFFSLCNHWKLLQSWWKWLGNGETAKKLRKITNFTHILEHKTGLLFSGIMKKIGETWNNCIRVKTRNTCTCKLASRVRKDKNEIKAFHCLTGTHSKKLGIFLYFWRSYHKQMWKEFDEPSDPETNERVEN